VKPLKLAHEVCVDDSFMIWFERKLVERVNDDGSGGRVYVFFHVFGAEKLFSKVSIDELLLARCADLPPPERLLQ